MVPLYLFSVYWMNPPETLLDVSVGEVGGMIMLV